MKTSYAIILSVMSGMFGWFIKSEIDRKHNIEFLRDAPIGWKVADNDSTVMVNYDFTQEYVSIKVEKREYANPDLFDSEKNKSEFYSDSLGRRHVKITLQ